MKRCEPIFPTLFQPVQAPLFRIGFPGLKPSAYFRPGAPASGFSGGLRFASGLCGCDFPGDFCFRFFYGSEKFPVAAGRFEGFDLPVQVRNGGLFGAEEITGPQHVVDGRDKVFVAVAAGQIT